MHNHTHARRSFLGTLAATAGLAIASPLLFAERLDAEQAGAPWDLSWLDALKGKHRQLFDVHKLEDVPGPLHTVGNYLDAHRDVFHLEFPNVNTVIGSAGAGFPINVNDAIWEKYKLADRWRITDDAGKDGARHNVFLDAPASDPTRASVKSLQARGTVFYQCDKALRGIAKEFALATHATFDDVYAELVAGLNPGVHLVPAHTMLVGLAQEHGCAYQSV